MDKLLYYGGIVLMVGGVMLIVSTVPIVQQSIVSLGPISAEVSEVSSTRIIIGAVLAFIGFFAYQKGK